MIDMTDADHGAFEVAGATITWRRLSRPRRGARTASPSREDYPPMTMAQKIAALRAERDRLDAAIRILEGTGARRVLGPAAWQDDYTDWLLARKGTISKAIDLEGRTTRKASARPKTSDLRPISVRV